MTLAERVLSMATDAAAGADVEVTLKRDELALTRFANSSIHQNVADRSVTVTLRVHLDGRTVAASTSAASENDGLAEFVARTLDMARTGPADPGWPGVTPPAEIAQRAEPPAIPSPPERAGVVAAFVAAAEGLETAGYCRALRASVEFANSAGHVAADGVLSVALDGIARHDGHDGTARLESDTLAGIDGHALGPRAAAKARGAANPVELPPGRYEVVLEPAAVADLVMGLSVFGFNGKAVAEGRSFAEVGTAQFDPAITIVDDPLVGGLAFDAEGTPSVSLTLVDRGVTAAVVHDRRSARETGGGAASTGHANGTPFGPIAAHPVVSPGPAGDPPRSSDPRLDPSAAAIVQDVERGILVSDLWYTRALDPKALTITGLTRNGVWLVERGEITAPLSNLRFTQAYVAALGPGNVRAVGPIASAMPDSSAWPRWTVPALHVASWNFTGGASG